MRELFVIPCKYTENSPIFDCVQSIKLHHPDANIMVMDSDSEDKSYFQELDGCVFIDAKNRNFAIGAYKRAIEILDSDYYYFLQDSVIVNSKLPQTDFASVRYFTNPPHGWGWDQYGVLLSVWGNQQLEDLGFNPSEFYTGIFGPMWICDKTILDTIYCSGLLHIMPEDKWQLCAMERILGIGFEQLGINVRNSLQGAHNGHFDQYDETYITKLNLGRM